MENNCLEVGGNWSAIADRLHHCYIFVEPVDQMDAHTIRSREGCYAECRKVAVECLPTKIDQGKLNGKFQSGKTEGMLLPVGRVKMNALPHKPYAYA